MVESPKAERRKRTRAPARRRVNPITAASLAIVAIALGAVYFFGPAMGVSGEAHAALIGSVGMVGSTLLAITRSIFARDDNHDGIPDVIQERLDR